MSFDTGQTTSGMAMTKIATDRMTEAIKNMTEAYQNLQEPGFGGTLLNVFTAGLSSELQRGRIANEPGRAARDIENRQRMFRELEQDPRMQRQMTQLAVTEQVGGMQREAAQMQLRRMRRNLMRAMHPREGEMDFAEVDRLIRQTKELEMQERLRLSNRTLMQMTAEEQLEMEKAILEYQQKSHDFMVKSQQDKNLDRMRD